MDEHANIIDESIFSFECCDAKQRIKSIFVILQRERQIQLQSTLANLIGFFLFVSLHRFCRSRPCSAKTRFYNTYAPEISSIAMYINVPIYLSVRRIHNTNTSCGRMCFACLRIFHLLVYGTVAVHSMLDIQVCTNTVNIWYIRIYYTSVKCNR